MGDYDLSKWTQNLSKWTQKYKVGESYKLHVNVLH